MNTFELKAMSSSSVAFSSTASSDAGPTAHPVTAHNNMNITGNRNVTINIHSSAESSDDGKQSRAESRHGPSRSSSSSATVRPLCRVCHKNFKQMVDDPNDLNVLSANWCNCSQPAHRFCLEGKSHTHCPTCLAEYRGVDPGNGVPISIDAALNERDFQANMSAFTLSSDEERAIHWRPNQGFGKKGKKAIQKRIDIESQFNNGHRDRCSCGTCCKKFCKFLYLFGCLAIIGIGIWLLTLFWKPLLSATRDQIHGLGDDEESTDRKVETMTTIARRVKAYLNGKVS